MAEEIIRVDGDNQQQLYDYSLKYGAEHDSSYLPGRDFELSEEHPSYLLVKDGQAAGAVSLMRTSRFLSVHKARFSILHSILENRDAYAKLLDAVRPHFLDLESVFLFIPEAKDETAGILGQLGFQVERYAFILEREGPALPAPAFPEGITVHKLEREDQDGLRQFSDCINEEFKDLAGHTHSTAEFIQGFFDDTCYLEGGVCLLKKGAEPIGTIAMMRDVDDPKAGEIMAFGVLEDYRGAGVGRNLFRYGFNFLIDHGLKPVFLSVNGENHNAIKLYQSEGFDLTQSVVCFSLQNPG
ncbi:MAG: GNAT family N-acetyltransferase [Anaerolineales bacterium]